MRAIEHYRLREAARLAERLDEPTRRAAREALERSAALAAEAETLWAAGMPAQGLARASRAVRSAVEAARAIAPDEPTGAALAAAGLSAPERAAVLAADEATEGTPEQLAPLHGERFTAALEGAALVQRRLDVALRGPDGVRDARRGRLWWLVALLAGLVALVMWPRVFPTTTITARASAFRRNDTVEAWPPANAIDRQETTYWHLPDGEAGWIELTLDPPQHVGAVRLLNAHDNHVRDPHRADRRPFRRASRDVRVHAFANGARVAEVDAALTKITDWSRVTISLGEGGHDDVDRIRIEVRSFFDDGGGLAEIEVLP